MFFLDACFVRQYFLRSLLDVVNFYHGATDGFFVGLQT